MKDNANIANPEGGLADKLRAAAELRTEIQGLESDVKIRRGKLDELSREILQALELMGVDSIKQDGFLFYRENRSSVPMPKTPEEKAELFDFLQQKGIFLEIASVNSQTLNSLYKSLAEEAEAAGNFDFKLPGVGEPTSFQTLKIKKG